MDSPLSSFLIGVGALILILSGILIVLQKKRTYYIPEGFVTEYPDEALLKGVKNPIEKTLKKLTSLSGFFMNIDNWKDVYSTYNMTPVELARLNIHKEMALSKKITSGK